MNCRIKEKIAQMSDQDMVNVNKVKNLIFIKGHSKEWLEGSDHITSVYVL